MPRSAPTTIQVNTAALRKMEPYLDEIVEQFEHVARYVAKCRPETHDSPGPSMGEAAGTLVVVARCQQVGVLDALVEQVRMTGNYVAGTVDRIVRTRELYERTEDDNTAAVGEIFGTVSAPATEPADRVPAVYGPPGPDPDVPAAPDLSTLLADPTTTGQGATVFRVSVMHGLPGPHSMMGKALMKAQPGPDVFAAKISRWVEGSWTPTLTVAACYARAAAAVDALRVGLEAGLDLVTAYWESPAVDAARSTFARTLTAVDALTQLAAQCGAYETATAQALQDSDGLTVDMPDEIVRRYRSFLDLDSDMGVVSSAPGVGWIIGAGMYANLVGRVVYYNTAYQRFCDVAESSYETLVSLRDEFLAWARGAGLCPPADGYPDPPPRY